MQQESGFSPWRIAVNAGGRAIQSLRYPSAEAAAAAAFRMVAADPRANIDLGGMQINWKAGHLQKRGLSPAYAFDTCEALRIAEDVLRDCWTRAPAREEQARLDEMASCYNTGGFEAGFANGYVAGLRRSASYVIPALRLAGMAPPAPPPSPAMAPLRPPAPPLPRAASPQPTAEPGRPSRAGRQIAYGQ